MVLSFSSALSVYILVETVSTDSVCVSIVPYCFRGSDSVCVIISLVTTIGFIGAKEDVRRML
jgi:hypothetical protein